MDSSFSMEEKRFVLAEILKSSNVGVENLLEFIRANQIVPNWMNIQVPLGRNLNQCMQVVGHMTDSSLRPKRPSTSSSGEYSHNHLFEHRGGNAVSPRLRKLSTSSATTPVAILPRPLVGNHQRYGAVSPSERPQPRKRGRPSRADKAKRDLNPKLPPHLAPRPPSGSAHRPILPAISRETDDLAVQAKIYPSSPVHSETIDRNRENKKRRLDDAAEIQQAGSVEARTETETAPRENGGAI